jgi:hypothetical protein
MITEDSIEISRDEMERIAQVAYEVCRLYDHVFEAGTLPDGGIDPPWSKVPEKGPGGKTSVRTSVQHIANNPASTAKDSHTSWMNDKLAECNPDGTPAPWKYGEVKNAAKKEHPCLVDYEKLPVVQRVRDRLFVATVRSLLPDLV